MYCSYLLVRSKFVLQILLNDANLEPIPPYTINECLSTRHTPACQRHILGRGVSGDFSTRPLHIEYCDQLRSNLLPNPTRTAPASQVTQQHRNMTSFPWFAHSLLRLYSERHVQVWTHLATLICRLQKRPLNDEVQVVNTISPSYKISSRPIPLSPPTDDAGDTLTRRLNCRHANIYWQRQK
jgi:hypothetical protein